MQRRLAAVGLLVAISAGCSDGMPVLVPVQGRVTLNDQPLAGKTVRFVPEAGTPGQGGGASTDPNGNYTLLAVRPGATRDMTGVPAGKYRVIVTEPMFPINLPVQDANEREPTPAIGLPAAVPKKDAIPAAYRAADTTPLRTEVPPEGGTIHLKLTR